MSLLNHDRRPLELFLLGSLELAEVDRLQRLLAYEAGEGQGGGALVLCEHPPLITVGRSGSRWHIRPDDAELRLAGIRTQWVARGGGCWLHLPGQVAAYLVLPVEAMGLSVADFTRGWSRVLGEVLADSDLRAEWRDDLPGCYLGNARVAAVGFTLNRGISLFGALLNVGPYLGAFELLDEPGPDGRRMRQTSMESRRQRPASMSRVRESLARHVAEVFGLSTSHVFTHHPVLSRRPVRPQGNLAVRG